MAPKAKKQEPVCQYDGPMEGEGTFYYKTGATYCGHWKVVMPPEDTPPPADGSALKPTRVRHGHGLFKDGDHRYEGEFEEDRMQGTGRFRYASGAEYSGQWRDNKYNGKGKYTWPDGKCYEGAFEDNVMQGQGCIVDKQGRTWSGKFVAGHGPGLTYDLP